MDIQYIQKAAEEHAVDVWDDRFDEKFETSLGITMTLGEIAQIDFMAGVRWMQERMEEIKLTENR